MAAAIAAYLCNALDDDEQLFGSEVCTAWVQKPLAQHSQDEVQYGWVCGASSNRLTSDEHDQGGQEVLAVIRREGECQRHCHCNMNSSGVKTTVSYNVLCTLRPANTCEMASYHPVHST